MNTSFLCLNSLKFIFVIFLPIAGINSLAPFSFWKLIVSFSTYYTKHGKKTKPHWMSHHFKYTANLSGFQTARQFYYSSPVHSPSTSQLTSPSQIFNSSSPVLNLSCLLCFPVQWKHRSNYRRMSTLLQYLPSTLSLPLYSKKGQTLDLCIRHHSLLPTHGHCSKTFYPPLFSVPSTFHCLLSCFRQHRNMLQVSILLLIF